MRSDAYRNAGCSLFHTQLSSSFKNSVYDDVNNGSTRNLQIIIKEDGALVLLGVNINATGLYKCEVSTDAQSLFFTVVDSVFVTVVEKPEDNPIIVTQNQSLQVGSVVKSSCTSRGGFPLANLTWFVDGEQITYPDTSRTKQYTVEGVVDSSVSELTLPIVSALSNGQLHLRCEASQFTLYNASAEVVLNEETSSSSGHMGGRESVMVSTLLMAAAVSIIHHSLLVFSSAGSHRLYTNILLKIMNKKL
uniref:Ig-like domain-containing protein n=1 Tax=Graphocephala atropunctata TaxID=36148 RepID=A0A1B6LHF2_9HEMI